MRVLHNHKFTMKSKDKKEYLFPKLDWSNPQASPLTPSIPSLLQLQSKYQTQQQEIHREEMHVQSSCSSTI